MPRLSRTQTSRLYQLKHCSANCLQFQQISKWQFETMAAVMPTTHFFGVFWESIRPKPRLRVCSQPSRKHLVAWMRLSKHLPLPPPVSLALGGLGLFSKRSED